MDYGQLIHEMNRAYPFRIDRLKLHREMIGEVLFAEGGGQRYVLKIFRGFQTADALQSVRILDYLQAHSYPAAAVLRTASEESHLLLEHDGIPSAAILYEYIEGETPDGPAEAERIGQQIGELHQLMESYPDPLVERPKATYIDDYLAIMRELNCDAGTILDLEAYGNELWSRILRLPSHFCHGDLHTGNMLRNRSGEYVLFDFDDASGDYPGMDIAYMSDDTHFNQFYEAMYDQTLRQFERLYKGYCKVRSLNGLEVSAVFDFIAVRHYQIIARIVRSQGLQAVSKEFCHDQHDWLMRWQELCLKKQ